MFDNDYLTAADARHTATVLSSTAAGDDHHYRAYDSAHDCHFAKDGSVLRWGDDLQIQVEYPHVSVRGRYEHFSADIELTVTDQVSYFVKTPVYDHQSLLTDVRARGAVACRLAHVRVLGKSTEVYTDVRMDVSEYRDNPLVDEEGRSMRIPHRLSWAVRDDHGHLVLAVDGLADSPLRYGHGRGYVGAYSYTDEYQGNPVGGSAYMEWVDTRR